MKSLLERIRAQPTTGLTWAVAWAPVGLILGENSQTPDEFPLDELSLPPFGALGAVGGALLGGILLAWWSLDPGLGPVFSSRAAVLVGATTLTHGPRRASIGPSPKPPHRLRQR